MKKYIQSILFGLSISLILSFFLVNADTPPEGEKYHRFLATPAPEGLYYSTRKIAIANIDDTSEKETIVLITADTGRDGPNGEWVQAFLLITENEITVPKKKALFKLFDAGTHKFDIPGKTIRLQSPPFAIREVTASRPWDFGRVSFKLIDLTGNGTLDIWVECAYGIAVISFQKGEFKEVCSAHSSFKREDPIEYVDLDNDGSYEIIIPTRISMDGVPTAAYPEWVSLFEWNGTTYVLNNERFYANNDEFLTRSLNNYNGWPQGFGKREEQRFYIGLIYYYRGNIAKAREFLQWVVEHGKKQDYVHAAEDLLEKMTPH